MTHASLRGDCDRCIGLCCVALAFDRGPLFAFGKEAGEACRHLDGEGGCSIHDRLEVKGMSGCVRYDCRGAGQIVTEMFRGQSWRDNVATARLMFLAFAKVREIQLMRSLVGEKVDRLIPALTLADGRSLAAVLSIDLSALRDEVRVHLVAGPRSIG